MCCNNSFSVIARSCGASYKSVRILFEKKQNSSADGLLLWPLWHMCIVQGLHIVNIHILPLFK